MTQAEEHPSRDERRRRTEAAILRAAQELFADQGFERTTIRAVAARAGVDPALVMQRYGNKEGLFGAAARWSGGHERILAATSDSLPSVAVSDLLDKFEGEESEAAVALMRNCLTHPSAARVMRDDVMCDRVAAIAGVIGGDDAALRASVFGACMMGVAMNRYMIGLEPLATASADDLRRVLEPVLRAIVAGAGPGGAPAADAAGG